MRTSSFRFLAPIFVAAALLAPPARAAGWASSPFEGIWARLAALWNASGGCVIDPNGLCRGQAGTPRLINAETGCTYDPPGGSQEQADPARGVTAEAGCIYDPNGLCRDSAQSQASGPAIPRRTQSHP